MREESWLDKFVVAGRHKLVASVPSRVLINSRLISTLRRQSIDIRKTPEKSLYWDDELETTLLPFQFSRQPNLSFEDRSLEGQIAYRFLLVNVLDVTSRDVKARISAIREIRNWMKNDARLAAEKPGDDGFEYTFDYWCEQLDVDAGYMRRKFSDFLAVWERNGERELAIQTESE